MLLACQQMGPSLPYILLSLAAYNAVLPRNTKLDFMQFLLGWSLVRKFGKWNLTTFGQMLAHHSKQQKGFMADQSRILSSELLAC